MVKQYNDSEMATNPDGMVYDPNRRALVLDPHFGWHWWTPFAIVALAVFACMGLALEALRCLCAWTWNEAVKAVHDVRNNMGPTAAAIIAVSLIGIAGSCLVAICYVARRII